MLSSPLSSDRDFLSITYLLPENREKGTNKAAGKTTNFYIPEDVKDSPGLGRAESVPEDKGA